MTKFINRLAAVAALALAATPIIGLTAAHAAEPPRIQVGDLTLANPDDAAEFVRRTRVAADKVCAARATTEKLRGLSFRACYQDFNADVRSELSREQITDLRAARRAKPAAFATLSLGLF
ncbi:MAG: UrcA family protein [Caulobacter sp. 12-67-6]|nr:MAG: UrcA family protein [Caulobacter sp. 12-67-6]OYX69495.1 MAG: UrcA family protein [Caulobacter sp. 32-67-35]